jgi:tetratricopeptide (TPR) repeat protein
MTAIRPNLLKLLAPLAAFGCTLVVLLALGGTRDIDPPAGTAAGSVDIPAGASTDQRIALLQRALGDGSGDAAADYASLGDAYLQKARESGDPSYYSRAERSFDAALRRDPGDVDALLGAGTLAGLRHDFREQLRLGLEARRLAPELVGPYPVVADAQVELGRYRAAERTLQRMLDLKPNLTSYARVSYYRELSGDLAGAVEAMRLAASAGAGAPENVAYVQVLLGDLELQRGRTGAARVAYTSALRSLPGYAAGMVGLARADAAGGDLGRAAARLRRAAQRLPLTETLVLLASVERELGRPGAADAALAAARAQQRLYRQAGTRPDAEGILFEADRGAPAAAVRLGRRVWRAAPSVRSADALGWALTRAGRPRAGYQFARRALRLGSRDPLFRLHAGIAAKEAALAVPAAPHLAVAAEGRAALSPDERDLLRKARR